MAKILPNREHLAQFKYNSEPGYTSIRDRMTDDDILQELSLDVGNIYKTITSHGESYKGRRVKLLTGKYKGYEAVIDSAATIDRIRHETGTYCMYFAVKVYKKDGTDFLSNWHTDSRRYYAAHEIELLSKE